MTVHAGHHTGAPRYQATGMRAPSLRLLRALALKRRLENKDRDPEIPLCVALDNTLLHGQISDEASLVLLRARPGVLLRLLPMAFRCPALFRAYLCRSACLDPARLPFRHETLRFLHDHHAKGRKLVLVGAVDRRLVHAIADHLGIFSQSLGSEAQTSLSPAAQARLLCRSFGPGGFDYVGADRRDILAWATARRAVVISSEPHIVKHPHWESQTASILVVPRPATRAWLDALQPSHWPRSLAALLPLLTLDGFTGARLVQAYCAACACGLVAAGSEMAADMVDLTGHRHLRSSPLTPDCASVLAGFLVALAFLVALVVSPALVAWLALYPVMAVVYARWLKHITGLNILWFSALDLHRLLAGGIAVGMDFFSWQVAVAAPFFLALAARHRLVELSGPNLSHKEQLERRVLPALGIAALLVGALVLALHIVFPG
jgi:hypothetical protein